jgi:pimeloyl-ACP methyl ester carboxylesterase
VALKISHHQVRIGSGTMHCVTCGAGRVVTFLHPVGLNGMAWEAQFEPLARHFQIVAPDLRGHGLSTGGDQPFTLDDLAADVVALWDALGVAASHVVGLSMGGMVAQALALGAPDRVRSLVLVDTAGTMSDQGRAAMRGRADVARQQGMAGVLDATVERWFTPEAIASGAGAPGPGDLPDPGGRGREGRQHPAAGGGGAGQDDSRRPAHGGAR